MKRTGPNSGYCFQGHACDRFGVPLDSEANNKNQKEEKALPAVNETIRAILKFIAHRNNVPIRLLRTNFGYTELDEILTNLQELDLIVSQKRGTYHVTNFGIQHLEKTQSAAVELTLAETDVLSRIDSAERELNRGEDFERLLCRVGGDVFDALKRLLKISYIFEDPNIPDCCVYRVSDSGREALRIAKYGL